MHISKLSILPLTGNLLRVILNLTTTHLMQVETMLHGTETNSVFNLYDNAPKFLMAPFAGVDVHILSLFTSWSALTLR